MESKIYKGCEKLYQPESIANLKELLQTTEKLYGDKVAFKFKTEEPGKFRTKTYREYIEEINCLGTALLSLGLKDKRIAVISENRYEWTLTYFATVNGTGVIVPLDRSLPEVEVMNLIEGSEAEVIFYSDKYNEIMEKVRKEKIGNIQFFISWTRKKAQMTCIPKKN